MAKFVGRAGLCIPDHRDAEPDQAVRATARWTRHESTRDGCRSRTSRPIYLCDHW
jgi:hypothetical protein